jgi:hypothetical protein
MIERLETLAMAAAVACPAWSEPGRVQARELRQLRHHARHDAAQPARLYLPMAIDGAEQRPADDGCLFCPILDETNRAAFGIRSI